MKKILLGLCLLIGVSATAQNRFPSIDSAKNYVLKFIRTSAVEAFTNYRMQNVTYGTLQLLDSISSSISANAVDSIFLNRGIGADTLKYSVNGSTYTIGILDRQEGIASGLRVTWSGTGLTFDVSPGVYYIAGSRYTYAGGQITLNAADGSNPRKDVIGVNTSGLIKITGTAAASPAEPQYGADTLGLTVVDIAAGATTPTGPAITTIYNENTEWTVSSSGVTVNANNTSNVFTGSKALDVSSFTNGNTITFTNASTINRTNYDNLKFYIRLKSNFSTSTVLQLAFLNGTTVVTNTVNLTSGKYGFVRTTTGSYQTITIPLSDFNFTNANFNKLRITLSGSNGNGFYLDYVQVQSGTVQYTPSFTKTWQSSLIDGSTLTQNNTIDGGKKDFVWDNSNQWQVKDSASNLLFTIQPRDGVIAAGDLDVSRNGTQFLIDYLKDSIYITAVKNIISGAVRFANLGASVSDTTTNKPAVMDAAGNLKRLTYWPTGGGGGSLPSQTGNEGKILTTDGSSASWTDVINYTDFNGIAVEFNYSDGITTSHTVNSGNYTSITQKARLDDLANIQLSSVYNGDSTYYTQTSNGVTWQYNNKIINLPMNYNGYIVVDHSNQINLQVTDSLKLWSGDYGAAHLLLDVANNAFVFRNGKVNIGAYTGDLFNVNNGAGIDYFRIYLPTDYNQISLIGNGWSIGDPDNGNCFIQGDVSIKYMNIASLSTSIILDGANNNIFLTATNSTTISGGGLDIQSTTGALIVPRMTTAQRTALTAVAGMIVYDTDLNNFYKYTTSWASF